MSIALKKDSSVLDEFEIPEHLGGVVNDLKKEQQTLKKEIEAVKSVPVVRKQDESTRVFNLRQHQIELKINELEEKKKQTEKELQEILQQKNSTLHTDLKKLAQFILQESKKIESKSGTISNLRNELQQVFESNLSDRKKNMDLIEEQNGSIRELADLIRDTSKLLQGDFHFLTQDIGKLQQEKQTEARRLSELKQEVAHHQGIADVIEARKKELKNLEYEIADGQKNALAFSKLDDQMEKVRGDIQRLTEENEKLERNAEKLRLEIFEGEESYSRLTLKEKHLENVISGKNEVLKHLDTELHDRRIQIEKVKEEEQREQIRILQYREDLSHLKNEIAKLEGSRHTYVMLLDESGKHFEEKKSFYQRESESLEKLHTARVLEFEASFEKKKSLWEEEFRQYADDRKAALKSELEMIDKQDLEDIRKKKSELLQEVSSIMSTILSSPGFQSSDERASKARKDVEKSFELVFGKTRRWKFW